MKKRIVAIVLMWTILLSPVVGYDVAHANQNDYVDNMTQQAEYEVEQIIDDLEKHMKELDEQKDIVDEQEVKDVELENAIHEMEQLETLEDEPIPRAADMQASNNIPSRIEKGFQKARWVIDVVNRQIDLKYQFVTNAGNTYRLTGQINENLNEIKRELKDIVRAPDREFTGQQFDQIKAINRELKEELKTIDYTTGQMTREVRQYIGHVRERQIKDAVRVFENMVYVQQRQIELLELILYNTELLLECLYNV